MSILEESKKSRTVGVFGFLKKKIIIVPLVIILAGVGIYYFGFYGKEEKTAQTIVPKEYTVKQTDLILSTEADGQVVAEDGVELSFNIGDDNLEVNEVYIKEGDTIQKGDKIASVETKTLELSLSSAWGSYQSALATYDETVDGATDEDIQDAKDRITSAEISLEQAEISLENTKQSAEDKIYNAEEALEDAKDNLDDNKDELSSEDVNDAYENLVDNIKAVNIALVTNLKNSDEIVGVDNKYLNDDFENNLGAKSLDTYIDAKRSYTIARDLLDELNTFALALSIKSDYSDIDEAALKTEEALSAFEKHFYDMKVLLENTIANSDLTQSALDAFASTVASARSSINTKITTLNTKIQAVDDAKDRLDDYIEDYEAAQRDLEIAKEEAERDIANSEASLKSKTLSLEQAKRDYDELLAPLTVAEIALAKSKLTSASVSLQKARNDLDEATITSPIDGEVVALNYKVGDIIVDNDDPVAVILNSETLFVEVKVEEADVSNLEVGQKAIATFDALDELELEGEISFISLTSETSNNGIVTYKVKVMIQNPEEQQIREGMTAYIDFIRGGVEDVLVVPVSAVRNVGGKPSVQLSQGEWQEVVTGFTDGDEVEIISGLNAGDKILY